MVATEEKILDIKVDVDESIKKIAKYRVAIEGLLEDEKRLKKSFKEKKIDEQEYRAELEQTKREILQHRETVRVLDKEVRNSIKVDKNKKGSLNALRAELSNLTAAYDALAREERENAKGTALLEKINTVTKELKEAEAATQRYYRNVGNYTSAWNGLGMSIQQVARELPSLSMGFNTFFLAISNNLPILADEISKARVQYSALVKEGKAATPVWKQVVGSIFSWQTALVAVVTLLSMYGKDIVNFTSNLFKSKKGIDAVAEATQALADARTEAISNSAEELSELQTLYKASQDIARSMQERVAAVDELQSKYPTYFGNMDKENILAGKAADSYNKLKDAILEKAKAQAIQDRLAKEYAKTMDLQIKLNKAQADMERYGAVSNKGTATKYLETEFVEGPGFKPTKVLTEEAALYNQATQDAARYNEQLAEQAKLEEELLKLVDTKALTEDFGSKNAKVIGQSVDEAAQKEMDAIREMEDALLNIIKDNQERQRKEIELSYDREIEDLQKRLDTEKDLTAKARDAIIETIKAKEKEKELELNNLNDEAIAKEIERQQKLIQLQLDAVKDGSEQEYQLKMQQLVLQRDAELQSKELTEQMKLAIVDKYNKLMNDATIAYNNEVAQKQSEALKVQFETAIAKAYGNEQEILRLQMEQKKAELDAIAQLEGESIEEYNLRRLQAENEYTQAKQVYADKQNEIEQSKLEAASAITGGLIELTEAIGESNRAAAIASKVLALAQIAIDTGKAISAGVAEAVKIGFPQNLGAIATTVATVLANIAAATKAVKSAKFATGGDVSGAGTATSDSIPAMLSNGESVMTAAATSMFAPILSAFNQAGGGVPIYGQQTGNQAMGEDMLARAFAKGVESLPSPVVSVEEINNVGNRVKVIDNISSI